MRHSQMRIIVEMAIGWLKATFKILTNRPTYPIIAHNHIIFACAGLMNWIKDYGGRNCKMVPEDAPESGWIPNIGEVNPEPGPGMTLSLSSGERDASSKGAMQSLRDTLARDMWEQYNAFLQAYLDKSSGSSGSDNEGESLVDTDDGCGSNDEDILGN